MSQNFAEKGHISAQGQLIALSVLISKNLAVFRTVVLALGVIATRVEIFVSRQQSPIQSLIYSFMLTAIASVDVV